MHVVIPMTPPRAAGATPAGSRPAERVNGGDGHCDAVARDSAVQRAEDGTYPFGSPGP